MSLRLQTHTYLFHLPDENFLPSPINGKIPTICYNYLRWIGGGTSQDEAVENAWEAFKKDHERL